MKKLDEEFICQNCNKHVNKLGYTSRNHCPYCLHSIHIDNIPGDRSNTCLGLMEPIKIEESNKKGYIIVFRCTKCGEIKRNKSAEDDNFDKILEITKENASIKNFRNI